MRKYLNFKTLFYALMTGIFGALAWFFVGELAKYVDSFGVALALMCGFAAVSGMIYYTTRWLISTYLPKPVAELRERAEVLIAQIEEGDSIDLPANQIAELKLLLLIGSFRMIPGAIRIIVAFAVLMSATGVLAVASAAVSYWQTTRIDAQTDVMVSQLLPELSTTLDVFETRSATFSKALKVVRDSYPTPTNFQSALGRRFPDGRDGSDWRLAGCTEPGQDCDAINLADISLALEQTGTFVGTPQQADSLALLSEFPPALATLIDVLNHSPVLTMDWTASNLIAPENLIRDIGRDAHQDAVSTCLGGLDLAIGDLRFHLEIVMDVGVQIAAFDIDGLNISTPAPADPAQQAGQTRRFDDFTLPALSGDPRPNAFREMAEWLSDLNDLAGGEPMDQLGPQTMFDILARALAAFVEQSKRLQENCEAMDDDIKRTSRLIQSQVEEAVQFIADRRAAREDVDPE